MATLSETGASHGSIHRYSGMGVPPLSLGYTQKIKGGTNQVEKEGLPVSKTVRLKILQKEPPIAMAKERFPHKMTISMANLTHHKEKSNWFEKMKSY